MALVPVPSAPPERIDDDHRIQLTDPDDLR